MPGPSRYLLLASVSAQTPGILGDLLARAGVREPLLTVKTDTEAVAALHDPEREPPIAIFVDVPDLANATRLITWIVSSPTTKLIPVFAIVGPAGTQRSEVEGSKPTAIVTHPLDLDAISTCVRLSPLLGGSKPPDGPPPPAAPPRRSPPFSILISL